jgi:hypothetical protein
VVEILIMGDFNRQDQLCASFEKTAESTFVHEVDDWIRFTLSSQRHVVSSPELVLPVEVSHNLMNECALSGLLKRGTKTWHGGGYSGDCESTIDLVLASENLTDSVIKCFPWSIF